MFINIKDGKVFGKASEEINLRWVDDGIPLTEEEKDNMYIREIPDDMRVVPLDTWNDIEKINIPDSPQRFEEPKKTELELLKEKIDDLEARLLIQEDK